MDLRHAVSRSFPGRCLKLGLIQTPINFLGDTTNARITVILTNVWRGIPFVAITLLAGLQTISPSLHEAATLDGATSWQRFRFITLPMLSPLIAVVMTFSVLFTFTDFQLIYVLTRGGPLNATHLMATLSFQRAIPGGQLAEGAAIAVAMVPFLLGAILFSYFGLATPPLAARGNRLMTSTLRSSAGQPRRRERRHELSQSGARDGF